MTQIEQDGRSLCGPNPLRRAARGLRRIALAAAYPLAAVAIALAFGALLLAVNGYNGGDVIDLMLIGVFQDFRSISEVLLKAVPLILIGAGLCVAFRCQMWNIGAEGQLYAGAVCATLAGTSLPGLSPWLYVPLIMLAGALGGAFWAGIAGWLKVRFQASEIVTTIMLNYIALIGTSYLVTGPMKDSRAAYPQSARLLRESWIPDLIPGTRLHIGILVALALAVALYVFLYRSSAGYGLRVVGTNAHAARYAGMNAGRNMMIAMCISGAMAGLAGAFEVAGVTHRLYQNISPGYGFEGIAVALLAANNPLGAILSGGLFAVLRSGSELMQITSQVPQVLVSVIQGIVILSVVSFAALRLRPGRH
ncbi:MULTISPECIES: ABC transporter permease [unclassified Paracoccus (in: a-proteobacteria)]|uniref:ABC transporter permease n=1 Tax=unclassified Paracoccus (in: a-proteobacteria) TaxID=2688777 RepID=UPI0012B3303A|nr:MULTISPECIES: ABC transporter permease [unclassified Paracoccus (in: a-proteobacteria)]UXU76591.1 ABC transporter permease [Paracoccus sp. SMMA_5]UXU82478.1 ABC transporter permease [Paracoccus sp. SMMA_5_TC]